MSNSIASEDIPGNRKIQKSSGIKDMMPISWLRK